MDRQDFFANFTRYLLKRRAILLCVLGVFFGFMTYQAAQVELSFVKEKIIPEDAPEMLDYAKFLALFEEEENIFVVGFQHDSLFRFRNFARLRQFTREMEHTRGVVKVLSVSNASGFSRNKHRRTLDRTRLFPDSLSSQKELDSLRHAFHNTALYEDLLYNPRTRTYLVLTELDPAFFSSERRHVLMHELFAACEAFVRDTGVELHYGGLPYMRHISTTKMKEEMVYSLLIFSVLTLLTLWLVFRSYQAVVIALLLTLLMISSVLGTVTLLDYRLNIFIAMLVPIITIISVTNCVYFIHRFHQSYALCRDKVVALSKTAQHMGYILSMTNLTTAVGFFVLTRLRIVMLQEVGWVASWNILLAYVVSMVFIVPMLYYLPIPRKILSGLSASSAVEAQRTGSFGLLPVFLRLVDGRWRTLLFCALGLVVLSAYGISKISVESFVMEDLIASGKPKQDLLFFEKHFGGVVPLEVVVDLGRRNGVMHLKSQHEVAKLQHLLDSLPEFSKSFSIINTVCAAKQAYYGGDKRFYGLPDYKELAFMLPYFTKTMSENEKSVELLRLTDRSKQFLRLSVRMQDMGSIRTESLFQEHLYPKVRELGEKGMDVFFTGYSWLFLKGNEYLLRDLLTGMLISFLFISLCMTLLFRRMHMIVVSLAANLLPLILVGGIMGYFGISLRFSTVLVFSISFGIAIDNAIHFLACYRKELLLRQDSRQAVAETLRQVTKSMVHTAFVLFSGFLIFTFSSFQGPAILGLLVSITLLLACLSNLLFLPALLFLFQKKSNA